MQYILRYSIICLVISIQSLYISSAVAQTTLPSDTDIYHRAYSLWITTAPTFEDAHLDGLLYRKVAAKMLSEFALQIVDRIPDMEKICIFNDIGDEIEELQVYMILACQLGIMGVDYYGNPDTLFNPNHFFTRDQLVTTLSRIYFGEQYNILPGEMSFQQRMKNFFIHTFNNITQAISLNIFYESSLNRYTKHMEVIKPLWIMTNYTPTLKEHRIHVLRILYTLSDMGNEEVERRIK